jgi:hypothetical protein
MSLSYQRTPTGGPVVARTFVFARLGDAQESAAVINDVRS